MSRSVRSFRAALASIAVLSTVAPASAELMRSATVPNTAYAAVIRSVNPNVQRTQSRIYAEALLSNARRMHVDPRLVMAVVTVESHWDTHAVSSSGARGLGQFLPGTARDLGVDTRSARSTLRGVTTYLHQLLGLFASSRHAMRDAIAGYNAGPFAVRTHGIPRYGETPRYVVKVMTAFRAFQSQLSPAPPVRQVVAILDEARRTERDQNAYWGIR